MINDRQCVQLTWWDGERREVQGETHKEPRTGCWCIAADRTRQGLPALNSLMERHSEFRSSWQFWTQIKSNLRIKSGESRPQLITPAGSTHYLNMKWLTTFGWEGQLLDWWNISWERIPHPSYLFLCSSCEGDLSPEHDHAIFTPLSVHWTDCTHDQPEQPDFFLNEGKENRPRQRALSLCEANWYFSKSYKCPERIPGRLIFLDQILEIHIGRGWPTLRLL